MLGIEIQERKTGHECGHLQPLKDYIPSVISFSSRKFEESKSYFRVQPSTWKKARGLLLDGAYAAQPSENVLDS